MMKNGMAQMLLMTAIQIFAIYVHGQEPCVGKDYFPPPPGTASLLQILQDPANPECQDLPKNSYRDYSMTEQDSPMGITANYRLQRAADGNYEVQLNVDFFVDGSLSKKVAHSGEKNKALNKKWITIANDCLKKMDGKIPAPHGASLRFRVSKGADPTHPPPLVRVGIADIRDTPRSHSRSWAEQQMSCDVIAHELLHLTGLPDEYREKVAGYKKDLKTGEWKFVDSSADHHAYDCRKIYDKNTVMAEQADAWTDMEADHNMKIDLCSCTRKDGCRDFHKDRAKKMVEFSAMTTKQQSQVHVDIPSTCPSGFKKNKYSHTVPVPNEVKEDIQSGKMVGIPIAAKIPAKELQKMTMAVSFEKRSLKQKNVLEKRQIDAILYPYCFAKNQKFFQDAQNAYRTSENSGGKGCANTELAWPRKNKQ